MHPYYRDQNSSTFVDVCERKILFFLKHRNVDNDKCFFAVKISFDDKDLNKKNEDNWDDEDESDKDEDDGTYLGEEDKEKKGL